MRKKQKTIIRTIQPPAWLPDAPPAREELIVTTFRITPDQHQYLKDSAALLSQQKGYGRADASEALRHLLQSVMLDEIEFKKRKPGQQRSHE